MYIRQELTADAVFRIKSLEETPFSEIPDGPRLTKGRFVLVYEGGLEGEGILEELKTHFGAKSASMVGLMLFTGRVGDLTNNFVLHHNGTFRNGVLNSKQTVLPGSATGGLKGLRGEMTLCPAASSEVFTIKFDYHFA